MPSTLPTDPFVTKGIEYLWVIFFLAAFAVASAVTSPPSAAEGTGRAEGAEELRRKYPELA